MAERYKPDGWPTVVPRLITDDVAGLAGFVRRVFAAEGEVHDERPAELRIGDSMIMISDGAGLRATTSALLYVYVEDADAAYARALKENAEPIEAPFDLPYGDRRATVRDAWGNIWQIATRL
jgi:PhnB protein